MSTFIEKLEYIYLNILRVVILLAATLALFAAVAGSIGSFPALARWSGLAETERASGGTLGQFIEERRLTATTVETSPDSSPTSPSPILPDVQEAARTITKYLGSGTGPGEELIVQDLTARAETFPGNETAYASDLREVTDELRRSHGNKLSAQQVGDLLDWHQKRFGSDIESRSAQRQQEDAHAWLTLATAGSAFVAFIFIIFVFIFVKIERNMRLGRTALIAPDSEGVGYE